MRHFDRPCVICGESFAPYHSRHVCCSADCQRERKRRYYRRWYAVPANQKCHSAAALRSYHRRKGKGEL